jgi:catechol 2,3-dioxygenase-like lactoylglutathione lyase family enzyme
MPNPNLIVLYVKDAGASAAFYEKLMGQEPERRFPSYVSFAFAGGLNLGLLAADSAALDALPAKLATNPAAAQGEIAFMVDDAAAVEALYADWRKAGVAIAQEPATLMFGRTFVALDPDGHRVRVCTPDK